MSTPQETPETQSTATDDLVIENKRSRWRGNISMVWLVPILALLISLGIAWSNYRNQGPIIEIAFSNASGVAAGETVLRFRDVEVGVVEDIRFSDDISQVILQVRVDQEVDEYIDQDAQFWVVRPTISASGVSGLDTVLSGVYLAGSWDTERGERTYSFQGLEKAPLTPPDQSGMRVRLRTPTGGSVTTGSPIMFKGIQVGTVEDVDLEETTDQVLITGFIDAPYDERITSVTRFWNSSGFDLNIGASGAELEVGSLMTLFQGGISFDTFVSGGEPVDPERIFTLYEEQQDARDSIFSREQGNRVSLQVIFDGTLQGLEVGAPVSYRGLKVGEVENISARVRQVEGEQNAVLLYTEISVAAGRIGLPASSEDEAIYEFLAEQVRNGLRAQLASANMFTGSLQVNLVEDADAVPAGLDMLGEPYPQMPSIPADPNELTTSAQGLMGRINNLPVEELLDSAITLMNSLTDIARREETQAVPGEVLALITDMRTLVDGDVVQSVPGDVAASMASLRSILEEIEQSEAAAKLTQALDSAAGAALAIEDSAEGLPAIVEQMEQLVAKANGLPLEDLITSTTTLVDDFDALLAADGVDDLPRALEQSLNEVRLVAAELREGGAVENLNSTLAAAENTMQSAEVAADEIAAVARDLPALADQFSALATRADQTLATLQDRGQLNRETVDTLREIREASRAVNALVTAIQRNPNSLIFGR
ncbi:MlaD family protein [Paracoccaceae bacterium GXU_MW_L88]